MKFSCWVLIFGFPNKITKMYPYKIVVIVGLIVLLQYGQCQEDGGYTVINKVRYPYSAYYTPFMGVCKTCKISLYISILS